jgi:CheY-like chemotaxis protein
MTPAILLVDDQRDILRLLHSALDSLKHPDLEILEAASGEAALEEVSRRRVDLLVTDYNLPGMTGIELIHTVRAGQPDIRVILITGNTDRGVRDEMLNAGAVGVFSKPIPLGDFLDAAERGLGFARTLLPSQSEEEGGAGELRVSELLANFRQDTQSNAVFLINHRGLVVARAGNLRDSSMEVSLISALAASFGAGLKVADSNQQDAPNQFSVFRGGDQDLVLMPVDSSYALLLAGNELANQEKLPGTIQAVTAVKHEVGKGLRAMGAPAPARKKRAEADAPAPAAPEMEALLKGADKGELGQDELDAYWDAAAAQHGGRPMSKDVVPYEEARKMGLTPDAE